MEEETRSRIARALPLSVPKVIDAQLGKVMEAEKRIRARVPGAERLARLLEQAGFVDYQELEEPEVRYEAGKFAAHRPSELHVIHAIAHRRVAAIFPAHGAEWVKEMLDTAGELSPRLRKPLEEAYAACGVVWDVAVMNERARRHCRGYSRNRAGCLVKVLLDNPPQVLIGRLLSSDPAANSVLLDIGRGEVVLEGSRLRYISRPHGGEGG